MSDYKLYSDFGKYYKRLKLKDSIILENGGFATFNGLVTAVSGITSPMGTNGERFGNGASVSGSYGLAVGYAAVAGHTSVALGGYAQGTGQSIAIGYSAIATDRNIAIGGDSGGYAFAITMLGTARAQFTGALGWSSQANHQGSWALGSEAVTTAANQMMIGSTNFPLNTYIHGNLTITKPTIHVNGARLVAFGTINDSVLAVGKNVLPNFTGDEQNAAGAVAFGINVGNNAPNNIDFLGFGRNVFPSTTVNRNVGVGLGVGAQVTTGTANIMMGYNVGNTITTGSGNIRLGQEINNSANTNYTLAFGNYMGVWESNAAYFGGVREYSKFYFNQDDSTNLHLYFTNASIRTGSNVDAPTSNWYFESGKSVGTANSGAFIFRVTPGGVAGSNQNAYVDAFKINGNNTIWVSSLNDNTGVAKMVTVNNGVFGYQSIPSGGGATIVAGNGHIVYGNAAGDGVTNNGDFWYRDGLFRTNSSIRVSRENGYISADAGDYSRLGMYKLNADDPVFAAGTNTHMRFGHLVGTNLADGGVFYENMRITTLGHVVVGTTVLDNDAAWDRVFQVHGNNHSRLLISSGGGGVKTIFNSHASGYYGGTAGGFTGTESTHPFQIIYNNSRVAIFDGNGFTSVTNVRAMNSVFIGTNFTESISTNGGYFHFLSNNTAAGVIKTGGLIITNDYGDGTTAPTYGIFSKGAINVNNKVSIFNGDASTSGLYFESAGGASNWGAQIINTQSGTWGGNLRFIARDAAGTQTKEVFSIDGEGSLGRIYAKAIATGTGNGVQMVTVSEDGLLSKQAIPTGGGGSVGSLQQVTDVGATTTNSITVSGSLAGDGKGIFFNNTDTSGYSIIRVGNTLNTAVGLGIHHFGTTWNGSEAAYAAGGSTITGFGTAGLTLHTNDASGKIKFFTGGAVAANKRMEISETGLVTIFSTLNTGAIKIETSSVDPSISLGNMFAPSGTGDVYFTVGKSLTNGNSALIGYSTVGGGQYACLTTYGRPATDLAVYSTGQVRMGYLAGADTRMVVADASGNLSTQAIPTGGGGSSLTINNNSDNRLLTANGTTTSVDAESGLTWDGTTLTAERTIVPDSINKVIQAKSGTNGVAMGIEHGGGVGYPRVWFDHSTTNNAGFANRMDGALQWWFGMANHGTYGGTNGMADGRFMGYYDFVTASWKYGFNASGELFLGPNNTSYSVKLSPSGSHFASGTLTVSNLAGTGSRMVVADANGVLSTQAIPATTDTNFANTNLTATGARTHSFGNWGLTIQSDAGVQMHQVNHYDGRWESKVRYSNRDYTRLYNSLTGTYMFFDDESFTSNLENYGSVRAYSKSIVGGNYSELKVEAAGNYWFHQSNGADTSTRNRLDLNTNGFNFTLKAGSAVTIAGSTTTSTLRVGTLEHQGYGLNNAWFGENVYFDGAGNFVHRASGAAGLFYFLNDEGQFRFYDSAAAGTLRSTYPVQFKVRANGQVGLGGIISSTGGDFSGATLVASSTNVTIKSGASVTIGALAGTGSRMVVADASGNLGTQAIPSGGTSLSINNNVDNRILTANGGTTSIDGEANLTFNGSSLGILASSITGYNSAGGATDAIKVVSNNTSASFGVQNTNATGFSGVEYIGSDSAIKVFTGYNNGVAGEFRFNNVATSGHIRFMINGSDAIRINNNRTLVFAGYTSGFLKTDASGNVTVDASSYVPTSRTININGTTYDLSADRAWTVTASLSGTQHNVPKFASTTALGLGTIYDTNSLVSVGTWSPHANSRLTVLGLYSVEGTGNANDYNSLYLRDGDGMVTGTFTDAGNWRIRGDFHAYYSFSDIRLKRDIVYQDNATMLEKTLALKPVTFQWNDREGTEYGFIAQDVEEVLPEVINIAQRVDDPTEYKRVDYEKLTAVLVGAIKELKREIEELKARL